MFTGAVTALVTPFDREGEVDLKALSRLVHWQVEQGIDGLLACGCTGEAATLKESERLEVVKAVLEAADGKVPVMAGTGTNGTSSTIDLSVKVSDLGVDGLLLITPYYNKPTAEGQFRHFTAVADAVDLPVYVYNVPGRTGASIEVSTAAELSEHPRIAGIKDAAGSAERVTALRRSCADGFSVLSGDDPIAMAQAALGADGVVSVTSNVAPAEMSELMEAAGGGDLERARGIQQRLYPVFKALFLQTNPIPVKCALSMKGMIDNSLRLPLVPLAEELRPRLRSVLEEAGLV
ncbi:4-hydroxy-tetrahydrodipicolinate synthase [Candidatus Fermentibacteria bacterium]|nr:4-hydroxy-tetrahydrodipicolinate synthase [Candidatus Fermentibacteria bacterium]